MVYDQATAAWYLFYSGGDGNVCVTFSTAGPTGPFTDHGSVGITAADAPDPVYVGGSQWMIFAASPAGTGGVIHAYRSTTGILGAYTDLGAVLAVGLAGAFDESRTYEPFVFLQDNGTWGMLYMGMNSLGAEQVGFATSPNLSGGGMWTRAQTTPIIANGASGTYDSEVAADPFMLKVGSTYYVFYVCGADGTALLSGPGTNSYRIACATGTSLTDLTKLGVVFDLGVMGVDVDSLQAFRGGFYWHTDGYIYYFYAGGSQPKAASGSLSIYYAKIDPENLFAVGPVVPWRTVEAEGSDFHVARTGTWTTYSTAPIATMFSAHAATFSNTTGDKIEFDFTGRRVRVWARAFSSSGIANISLDGGPTIARDNYANDATGALYCIYDSGELTPGAHTLVVSVSGTKNPSSAGVFIELDRFDYVPSHE